ncbi:WD-repeat protein mip1 [Tremella mesenterica]|uniref:WD-repeat protein mip1 n=1 Tax=Tremella mesenterica TaxID=5217 RepID=A0A4Q1BUD6_TREME|nr:uncharacterized protein TREMEDRAFT_37429 [Tremella mesenterica DSM 1558]EIW73629.1 hypothetical protein TREMEDRAFT_37429 [Tremella mesenterica DSM 1558]RXK41638.1 WD-repeat protein mip1 [Tremella mesenterica]
MASDPRDQASSSHVHPYHDHPDYDLTDMDGDEYDEGLDDGLVQQYWTSKQHKRPKLSDDEEDYGTQWRLKTRLKTVNAGLFICLNIGVDPPDIVKTNPCAKLECWTDPTALPSSKAIEAIGRNLASQFDTLSPKVKYKYFLDPSIEETKKQCVGLRKIARDERTVFYYNGHGVPKPTNSGEIWVFNKNYTQYIPVSLYDLQDWLGSPCIYIWECSGAGNILTNFSKQAERKDHEARQGNAEVPSTAYSEAIHLAACTATQNLPMSPELPADLFTSCLTSPIEIALRFFVLQDPLKRNINSSKDDPRSKVTLELLNSIPGDLKDRRTPLGELNWIFTAVTDTIAWTSFPREVFNKLFRQDLLVAALFRNFLLAQRIMSAYHCTPMSIPEIPSTHNHHLWHSWDLAVDECLAQLPHLLELEAARESGQAPTSAPMHNPYIPSSFFAQHLQAFEIWLQHGGNVRSNITLQPQSSHRQPPEQLPIVLQVLLSQAHRLRALILLSQFVDLGPWAVSLSLSIGIFPYVSKLLQSPAPELKPVLIFIWARILAVDRTCQIDLLRDQSFSYFAQVLAPSIHSGLIIPHAKEHRAMCAFILSIMCRNFRAGQQACLSINVFDSCIAQLGEEDWLLKTWCLLCLAQMWADNDEAKAMFLFSKPRQDEIMTTLHSNAPEVRAAALYAIGTLMGASAAPLEIDGKGGGGTGAQLGIDEGTQLEIEAALTFACLNQVKEDAAPIVRKELVVLISCVVREWRGWMVAAAWTYYEQEATLEGDHGKDVVSDAVKEWVERVARRNQEAQQRSSRRTLDPMYLMSNFKVIFETLLDLSVDPDTTVASMASTVVDYIVALLLDSAFCRVENSAILRFSKPAPRLPHRLEKPQAITRTNTEGSSNSIKRNASMVTALRSLATITGWTTDTPPASPPLSDPEPVHNAPGIDSYRSPYPDASHERILPDREEHQIHHLSAQMRKLGLSRTPVSALAVLEALTDEDMERLSIRRLRGTQAGGDNMGRVSNNGLPRPNDLGLGMVAKEVKDDVLPLRSRLYDEAMDYFKEPQMRKAEADDQGSKEWNAQAWRHQRNQELVLKCRTAETYAPYHSWDNDAGTLANDSWPLQLRFHSYDPIIAVTDDTDNICIWDWKERRRLSKFRNLNVPGSSISSLHFINETASSLLLTASTEGAIRIWRNYENLSELWLASSFRAVSELHPAGHSSGLLTAWEQPTGHLLVGGDMRVVRLWDATVERHLRDIATQAGANLTAIASDELDCNIFVAGFGDGVVRLFDKRVMDAKEVVLRTWRNHQTWIQSVHLQRGAQKQLVTGSMNGDVRIWDVRSPEAPLYEVSAQPTGLQALAVHTNVPVFATSSAPAGHATRQKIVVQGFSEPEERKILSTIGIPLSPYAPRNASFMPSATSLMFHPTEMVFAATGGDPAGTVRLFQCATPEKLGWEGMNGYH